MANPRAFRSRRRVERHALAVALAAALGAGGPAHAGAAMAVLDQLDKLAGAPPADASRQSLYLDIVMDGRVVRPLVPFWQEGSRLFVEPGHLEAAGLVLPTGLTTDDRGRIALDAVPGLSTAFDPTLQRVVLTPSRQLRQTRQFGYQAPAAISVRRDHGLVVDWDAYGRTIDDQQTLSLGTGLRWFGRWGTLETRGVSRAGDGDDDAYSRLDSRWTYSDPERMWTWTAGDLVSGGLAWTRPVRLGGVQLRRDFATRPDLIVYPVPAFSADATVPSSVELYINNVRQLSEQVDPGPFVLTDFPRIAGAGQAVVVVTDALGRTTQTTVPLYVDYQRLARGLTDFSIEAGVMRRGFGVDSNDYDSSAVASGSWRVGASDDVTFELHGEGGGDLALAGGGVAWSPLGRYGVVTANFAHSRLDDRSGKLHGIGYQWFGQNTGIDLLAQRASDGYRDLGDLDSVDAAGASLRRQDRASGWIGVPRGSLSATWLRYRDHENIESRNLSVGLSQTFGRYLSLSLSAFDDSRAGHGWSLSMSVPLGRNLSASASVDRSGGDTQAVAGVRRMAPYEGGWGWDAQARDDGDGQLAATWRGRGGEAWFGVDRVGDDIGAFAQGNGSIVVMDGQAFPSRRISDAFAVVSTRGVADVPILYENRPAGRTDANGYLLLSDLRGWQRNRIAIDPDELPAQFDVPAIEQLVTPSQLGGVQVDYALSPIRSATVVLHDAQGQPVTAGTRVQLGDGASTVVGYDGELWVERYRDGDTVRWTRAGQSCSARLPGQSAATMPVRIGPLRCNDEVATP